VCKVFLSVLASDNRRSSYVVRAPTHPVRKSKVCEPCMMSNYECTYLLSTVLLGGGRLLFALLLDGSDVNSKLTIRDKPALTVLEHN
jgi:hypothetical protein